MDRGAHYFACDFQVHSPLDQQWKGPGKGSEEEKAAYARSLVAACRAKGISAIAITDHHEMGFISYLRSAAIDERGADGEALPQARQLVVFPGMELTLGVPCQALLIFDADFPQDMFSLAATALAIPTVGPGTIARLDSIQSLLGLKEELDKHQYLRGRYIVFPNVSDSGSSTILRAGFASKYVEMPCVGGYCDGGFAKMGSGNRDILAGKNHTYGNKKCAVIQTSDNRSADHKLLGKYRTWIKWAVPTAEALRQACLAQESRISLDEPALPDTFLDTLEVTNSTFLGPIALQFNRQYNALIGGRGTGKSSILEYLRWGLCDQPSGDVEDSELPNYQKRRSRLIENTLQPVNGRVEVRFSVNNTPHVLRRDSITSRLELKIGAGTFEACSEEQARALLPVQAYSQKQLSDVSVRLDELLRFVTTPIKAQLDRIDSQLNSQAAIVREKYSARERRRGLEAETARGTLVRTSLVEQAAEIRRRLTDLRADDQELIAQAPVNQQAIHAVDAWKTNIEFARDSARQTRQRLEAAVKALPPVPEEHAHAAILTALRTIHDQLLTSALAALSQIEQAAATVLEGAGKPTSDWISWQKQVAAFNERYAAAAQRSTNHMQRLQELASLDNQTSDLSAEANRLGAEIEGLREADAACDAAREAIVRLRRERASLLAAQCTTLSTQSGGLIRATIQRNASVKSFVDALKQTLRGSGVRGTKIDALADTITKADNPDQPHGVLLAELELLAIHNDTQAGDAAFPATPFLTRVGFTASDIQKITGALTQSDWLRLSLINLEDEPVFEYRAKENEYIPFANASAGQQATALLSTLLNSDGPPLIVDQPEEDLDNNVVQDIVELIWSAKHKRQLIFASHNANLVVNGDADLVVRCDYRTVGDQSGGKIAAQGAIDIPEIKSAITEIMEGGRAAFELRYHKYGF